MVNLVLHCGARHVERKLVERAETPPASETWVPVPHHRLLEQVEATLTVGGCGSRMKHTLCGAMDYDTSDYSR